jgi:hypothetical protein
MYPSITIELLEYESHYIMLEKDLISMRLQTHGENEEQAE